MPGCSNVHRRVRFTVLLVAPALLAATAATLPAQTSHRPLDVPGPTATEPLRRTRLILKDGSFQLVLSYKVEGTVVRYRSAERDGALEDIPLNLVDLPATERWRAEHDPLLKAQAAAEAAEHPPVLSPELQREEAARARPHAGGRPRPAPAGRP